MIEPVPQRRPFQGLFQILRFNWPYYATSVSTLVVAGAALSLGTWPRSVAVLGWLGWLVVGWWTLASLVASHVIYDRSPLMKWTWVAGLLRAEPLRWVNIHSGLDESTLALRVLLEKSNGEVLDIFDRGQMSEPSIQRAQRQPSRATAVRASHAALPLPDASMDAVFLFFAAHELRTQAAREQLFGEVTRVLIPGGRLLLAEHARDVANLTVFGPGFLHFLPHREWLRLARHSGLTERAELRITPFVRVWSFEKKENEIQTTSRSAVRGVAAAAATGG